MWERWDSSNVITKTKKLIIQRRPRHKPLWLAQQRAIASSSFSLRDRATANMLEGKKDFCGDQLIETQSLKSIFWANA